MLKTFITALQNIEIHPTAEELADLLWLTKHVRDSGEKPGAESERPERLPETEKVCPEPPESAPSEKQIPAEQSKVAGLHPRTKQKSDSRKFGGIPFRSPGVPMLPEALHIGRALRPFMSRIPSRTRFVLDEAATIHRIAEERVWIPVLKGEPERWFDVALVVEQSPSMVIWHPTLAEFRRLLMLHGAFRDVRTWQLKSHSKTGKLQIFAGMKSLNDDAYPRNPSELINPQGRRLILVVSDCVSPVWYRGTVNELLALWGKHHPIAILQMLPRRMWQGSGLGESTQVNLQAMGAESLNTRLLDDYDESWFEETKPEGIKIPVVTLEPDALLQWARMVSGRGEAWVPGFIFECSSGIDKQCSSGIDKSRTSPADEEEIHPIELPAEERIQNFYATASPTAQQLAGFLSAAPLTLPVIRLVQQAMLPDSRQVHLAEVFLGGLIKRVSPLGNDPNLILYDFHDGVRELLLDMVLIPEAIQVLRRVSAYLEQRMGQALDFQAWLSDPTAVNAEKLEKETLPFAFVSAKVLSRLGGEYAALAARLEERQGDLEGFQKPSRFFERFTNSIGMEFVYIPPGIFMMGSPKDEPGRFDNETLHQVTLTRGFYMQTTPVTQGQWKAVMGDNPSYFKEGDNYPVENISWNDTQEFIEKLNQMEERGDYRLPTEAEWEYACRAGTTTPFFFGKCLSTDQANYDGNYPLEGCPKGEYREKTTPVKHFPPNDRGLHDMHGNVYEWCSDWYGEYPADAVTNPTGPPTGSGRVIRGGSWYDFARYCRSAYRFWYFPSNRNDSVGFRLAFSPGQQR